MIKIKWQSTWTWAAAAQLVSHWSQGLWFETWAPSVHMSKCSWATSSNTNCCFWTQVSKWLWRKRVLFWWTADLCLLNFIWMKCKITAGCCCTRIYLPQSCVCVYFDESYVSPSAFHLTLNSFHDSCCINSLISTKDWMILIYGW